MNRLLAHTPMFSAFGGLLGAGLLLSLTTGCGMLGAMANPKVAWAIQDPAPMSVVVKRADAASTTASEVERLLTKTPTSNDSAWLAQVGPDPKDAAAELKALTMDPMYMKSKARVISADVWMRTLPSVQNAQGDKPNLLAAIDPDLGDSYSQIIAKKVEIAGEKALIDQEKAAIDDKATSADDKKEHQATEDKLEKMVSTSEDEVAPLEKKFLDAVKVAAKKAPADVQAKFAPALANLLQAVDDADIANSAAAVRYPLAIRSILDSAKEMAPIFVADIIEEKTGTRPSGQLEVGVTLDGSKVTLDIKGLTKAQLGSINVGDVTTLAIDREQKWVTHAIGLLPFIGQTKETLSFEHEVLAGLMDGFGGNATKVVAVTIPAFDSKEVTVAVPKPHSAKVAASVDVKVDAKVSAGGKVAGKADAKADVKVDVKAPAGKVDVKGGKAPAVKGAPDKKATDKGDAKGKVDHKEGATASAK
jgi:hypothetical protein